MQQNQTQSPVAAFIHGQFPGKLLLSIRDFAGMTGESYGGLRNRLSLGTFPLPVVRRGARNFVSVFDVIMYVECITDGREFATAVVNPAAAPVESRESAGKRISKYGEEAKARAAATKAKRQEAAARARAARAAKQQQAGEVAA